MIIEDSKIAFVQKQCKSYSNISAEGLMYGVANIMTMKPEILDILLEEEGYIDKETFADEQCRALEVIRKAELDLELIKNGALLILPFYAGTEESIFYRRIARWKQPYFQMLVSYIISNLDEDYRTVFHEGNSMNDVLAFRERLENAVGTRGEEFRNEELFGFLREISLEQE